MKKVLLIVDDDLELVEKIKNFLQLRKEFRDWSIVPAYNGPDGIEEAKRSAPTIILVDILLVNYGDDQDGYELILEIRKLLATKKSGIIVYTGQDINEDSHIRALRSGADYYLTKTSSIPMLEETILALYRRMTGHFGAK